MTEPSLPLQAAIRARLVAASAVTSIIPASAIVDRNATPALDNSIVIGEAMTGPDDGLARHRHMIVADVHVWRKEPGLVGTKQVVGAIRAALSDGPLSVPGFHVVDLRIASSRFLRDPGGHHSHGILSLEARLVEIA
ncbi:DUF3168 domain-containing protein [Shinella daejeonensis]|uniref:DUF3168 domain-containing protein n=1 Tax=Shinella daejeonensis TaxID=659017 RepID=UPI0020C7D50E|nr:DUF3168 domain-containing protein [Shinella daejeonensis]MCP8894326.1 DUF3168 domain-containing protein [Shinella daejeonensis]